jgi:hypothetical protein
MRSRFSAQRGAGRRDVDDLVGQADERRDLDVAVQLHDLDLHAFGGEVLLA